MPAATYTFNQFQQDYPNKEPICPACQRKAKYHRISKRRAYTCPEGVSWESYQDEERKNIEQIHRHKKWWAGFIADRFFVLLILIFGAIVSFTSQNLTLQIGYISAFSGVAGALVQKIKVKITDE